VLDRLLAVQWDDEEGMFAHARSRAALMREYLRRMAYWADLLDADDVWPFFDVAARIGPNIRADETVVADLETYLWNNVGWPSIANTCRAAVNWAALRSRTQTSFDLPAPFEPLLLMYERGGGFSIESDFIDLNGAMVPLRRRSEYLLPEEVVDLQTEILDQLDSDSTTSK